MVNLLTTIRDILTINDRPTLAAKVDCLIEMRRSAVLGSAVLGSDQTKSLARKELC